MHRIVFTGPPSSGKTTTIEQLAQKGFTVKEEYSRQIIEVSLKNGTGITPWDKLEEFSKLVFEKRVEQYNEANEAIVLYDRSVFDTIAYLHYDKLPTEYYDIVAQDLKYHKTILFFPFWETIFTTDGTRLEDLKRASEIEQYLRDAYLNHGYKILDVPFDTIENRVIFIENYINSITN